MSVFSLYSYMSDNINYIFPSPNLTLFNPFLDQEIVIKKKLVKKNKSLFFFINSNDFVIHENWARFSSYS